MAVPAPDLTPLIAPVTREEVHAWRDAARATGYPWAKLPATQLVNLAVGAAVVVLVVVPLGTGIAAGVGERLGGPFPVISVVIFFAFLAVIGTGMVRAAIDGTRRWERMFRLARFAQANGLRYSPEEPAPGYPGVIFGHGYQRVVADRFTTTSGRTVDFGNLRYFTGSGRNRRLHQWGFLAIGLDRRLPHMVLDSRANNSLFGLTNLPAMFDRGQVLGLEGDFGRYFTLYCPREYERDALYVFTLDLMALLIDEAAPYDVEVIDHWMLVYSAQPFPSGDPEVYRRLFRIVATVGAKAVDRSDRYSDERTAAPFAANIVAPQGARLKRRMSATAIVALLVFGAIWMWSILADFIASGS